MERGILYGVGVGPGDPELMTLKAVRVLREVSVICLPKLCREECRAYRIAASAVPELEQKEFLCFDFEMIRYGEVLREKHRKIFEIVREHLDKGRSLAFLTIGDPTIYASFSYLAKFARADGYEVEWVNGVTSFCACAAECGISLCEGDEELHLISGQENPEEALRLPGTKILMKSGRRMPKIKEELLRMEKQQNAEIYAVQECGTEKEKIYEGALEIPEEPGYMTTILIKTEKD